MANLIIRRLLLLAPTLCVILIGTYALSTFVPGDEVGARLRLAGESSNIDDKTYERSYRELEQELGLSGPLFYMSLVPNYFPVDPYDIVPKSRRQTLLKLNHEVRDWSSVLEYHHSITALLTETRGYAQYRELSMLLNRMMQADNVTQLLALYRGVTDYGSDSKMAKDIDNLDAIINRMTTQSAIYWPDLRWNGTDNQFHRWLNRLFSKENISLRDGVSVMKKIGDSIAWTASLSILTLLTACMLAIIVSVWLVGQEASLLARIVNGVLYLFYAIPLFWLATVAVIFLTTKEYGNWTHIFPSVGIRYWELSDNKWSNIGIYAGQLILPLVCMTLVSLSYLSRQLAADMNYQKMKLYATVALAKGVSDKRLRWRHLLPNALMPYITIVTGALPRTIVGSAVIEYIFSIPGMGKLLLDSIYYGDWPVIFMIILLVGILTIISYLLADILYAYFYPNTTILKTN